MNASNNSRVFVARDEAGRVVAAAVDDAEAATDVARWIREGLTVTLEDGPVTLDTQPRPNEDDYDAPECLHCGGTGMNA